MHFLVHDHIPQSLDSLSNHDQLKCPGRVRTMQGEGPGNLPPFACGFSARVKPTDLTNQQQARQWKEEKRTATVSRSRSKLHTRDFSAAAVTLKTSAGPAYL